MEFNIKLATTADSERIVESLTQAYEEGPYFGKHNFSPERALEVTNHILDQDKTKGIILLGETPEKEIVGIFGAMVTFTSFSFDPTAAEMLWWVAPKARKTRLSILLLDGFEMWSKKIGVSKLVVGSMENDHSDGIDKFYKRRGYKLTERTYFKELM